MKWHRRAGIISALFVIILSLSGLVLHHSTRLSLDRQYIGSATLRNWYGLEPPEPAQHFVAGAHSITTVADALYFDTQRIPGSFGVPVGFGAIEFGYAVAFPDSIVLLTDRGQLIETLTAAHGVPRGMRQLGTDAAGAVYVTTPSGTMQADLNQPEFVFLETPPGAIEWSRAAEPGSALRDTVRQHFASTMLSWERLVLDIHSGRVLGGFGLVLVDFMALLFVFMAATGVWIWSRRRS